MWRDVDEEQRSNEPASSDCVFCKIVAGELPSRMVYEDDLVVAFHDVTPVAKVHVLVVPREHFTQLDESTEANEPLLGRVMRVASEIAKQMSINESGYRIAVNQGADAGQIVDHLHMHVLGGQNLYPLGETITGTEG